MSLKLYDLALGDREISPSPYGWIVYIVIGCLMWPRLVFADDLFETSHPVDAWRERMLDLFGGYSRKAKRVS